ncbi:tyrosine serine [Micractinium conductrix]|uniref:Tyrosine serine n=1 Tax=Micractinium conductrix TaxID=554055 RepID=A0A2P6V1N0_9CHLO|nr:tyrosine serine [Micractinium conductrix]|eukprot:PSC68002.1 tyrosine serine [Micractinium conductrix]
MPAGKKAGAGPSFHHSPSAVHLSALSHILNARDLAEASPKLKPGRIFRSGSPAHASLEDVLLLRKQLHVQHMLDFRSPEEHGEDSAWSLMLSNGLIKTYDQQGNITQVSVDHNAALHGIDLEDIQLHRLSLLERRRVMRGMIGKLPWSTLLWAGWYKLRGDEEAMRDVLVPEVNKGGLLLIYQILVDTAQADLAKSLQIVTAALDQRQPCLFFCKLGKDRTGLMAALVLAACGASDEEIVADYVRSAGVHQVALGGLEKQSDLKGMDEAVFSAAPPEAMRGLLDYCRQHWGSLRGYMEAIGFTRDQQERLAAAMTRDW